MGQKRSFEFERSTVALKAEGLTDALAATRPRPSLTAVIGLLQHLADVERSWILADRLGLPFETRWNSADPDRDFRMAPATTLAAALAAALAMAGVPLGIASAVCAGVVLVIIGVGLLERGARTSGRLPTGDDLGQIRRRTRCRPGRASTRGRAGCGGGQGSTRRR